MTLIGWLNFNSFLECRCLMGPGFGYYGGGGLSLILFVLLILLVLGIVPGLPR
jgi:hypothetical protein